MPLSTEQVSAWFERKIADPALGLLECQHAAWNGGVPIRLARNPTQDITSNGNVFTKSWFDLELPSDDEVPAACKLGIHNIDGVIGREIDQLTGPITCAIYVVAASDPDSYARAFLKFKLRNVQWDAFFVTGELSQATITNNRWPKYQITPKYFRHLIA